jgi:hypothetical protein
VLKDVSGNEMYKPDIEFTNSLSAVEIRYGDTYLHNKKIRKIFYEIPA